MEDTLRSGGVCVWRLPKIQASRDEELLLKELSKQQAQKLPFIFAAGKVTLFIIPHRKPKLKPIRKNFRSGVSSPGSVGQGL